MSINGKKSTAFMLSLAGGIMILGGGIASLVLIFVEIPQSFDMLADLRHSVGEEEFRLFQIRYTVAGISTGIAVILTSFMLKMRPQESKRWGIMVIVLSAMSIMGMGGFIVGMALGIIGGAIAIMRGKSLAIEEQKQFERKTFSEAGAKEGASIIYRCSSCNSEFKSDEELKQHVLKMHMKS